MYGGRGTSTPCGSCALCDGMYSELRYVLLIPSILGTCPNESGLAVPCLLTSALIEIGEEAWDGDASACI
jgi:hypothetical protein